MVDQLAAAKERIRVLETLISRQRADLDALRSELAASRSEVARTERQLKRTAAELEKLQTHISTLLSGRLYRYTLPLRRLWYGLKDIL